MRLMLTAGEVLDDDRQLETNLIGQRHPFLYY